MRCPCPLPWTTRRASRPSEPWRRSTRRSWAWRCSWGVDLPGGLPPRHPKNGPGSNRPGHPEISTIWKGVNQRHMRPAPFSRINGPSGRRPRDRGGPGRLSGRDPGDASFTAPERAAVRTSAGTEEIEFKDAIIATGGRPSDLPMFRFDGKRVLSTKEALELPRIPLNLAVIGGGISGLEIGTFYAKLGTRVVVIEILDQILPGTDPEATRIVARRLQKLGIEVHTKSQARGWRVDRAQTVIDVLTPEGLIARRADCVLVSVGRRPNTDELNVDRAGVEFAPRGYVRVDRQLRTSNRHVLALGDVVGPPFLPHKATKEGLIAAEVIAGHPAELDYRALPAAIFTDPEIATVGLQEPEAVAQGRKVRIGKVPFAAIGRALTTGEYDGFVKLLADPSSNVLLGATIAGPDASDLISELSLGIEMGATIADIALTIHPHPTLPEAIMESAEAALGEAIHVLNR